MNEKRNGRRARTAKYMNKNTNDGPPEAFVAQVRNLKVIALDCDGVLFDSREANIHFYSHIMKIIGRPPVRADQHEFIHMHPVRGLWST